MPNFVGRNLWQVKIDKNKYSWEEAFIYANHLSREKYGGYSDWRVPNNNELKTLLTREPFKRGLNKTYIKEPLLKSMPMGFTQWFWSSTEDKNNSSGAWFIDFSDGFGFWDYKSDGHFVRCVLGGQ